MATFDSKTSQWTWKRSSELIFVTCLYKITSIMCYHRFVCSNWFILHFALGVFCREMKFRIWLLTDPIMRGPVSYQRLQHNGSMINWAGTSLISYASRCLISGKLHNIWVQVKMVKGCTNSVAVLWVISCLSAAFVATSVGPAFQGQNA